MTNDKIFVGVGILMIFMFVGGMAIYELSTGTTPFELYGVDDVETENLMSQMQILNIGKASFVSNNPSVSGDAFIMNVVQNGMGDSAIGEKSSSDLVTVDGSVATETITVTSRIDDYRCNYAVTTDNEFTYKYSDTFLCNTDNLGKTDSCGGLFSPFSKQDLVDRCTAVANSKGSDWKYTTVIKGDGWLSVNKAYCVTRIKESTSGKVSSPTFSMASTFNVDIGADKYSLKLGLNENTGAYINSVVTPGKEVMIYYTGSFVNMGTQSCPQIETNLKWQAIRTGTNWKLVPQSAYNSYIFNHENTITNCLDDNMDQLDNNVDGIFLVPTQTYAEAKNCQNIVNDLTDTVSTSISIPNNEARIKSVSANEGILSYFPTTMSQFPTYQLIVRADELNIVRNSGKPQIDKLTINDLKAGSDKGIITVDITNIGTASASFSATATCNNNIKVISSGTTSAIAAKYSGRAYIEIVPPANIAKETVGSNCVVTVADRADVTIKDTDTVYFNLVQDIICVKGTVTCEGLKAKICTGIGSEFSPENDAQCEEPDDPPKVEGCMTNTECNDNDYWTTDTCDKSLLQQTFDKPGECKNTSTLPFVIIGSVFVLLLVMVGVAVVVANFKKK